MAVHSKPSHPIIVAHLFALLWQSLWLAAPHSPAQAHHEHSHALFPTIQPETITHHAMAHSLLYFIIH